MGHTPPTKHDEYYVDGTIEWVRIQDVRSKHVTDTGKKLTALGFEACSAKMVPANTCLMTVTKTIGRTGIATHSMAISQSVVAFIPDPLFPIDPEYLYYYLPTVFVPKVQIGAPTDMGKREVDSTVIRIPGSLETQREIVERIRHEEKLLEEMEELFGRNLDNVRTLKLNLAVKYLPQSEG